MSDDGGQRQLLRRAFALAEIERFGDAVLLFEQALAADPDDAYLLTCVAWALRQAGNPAGAEDFARRATQADPDAGWAFRELAHLRLYADDAYAAYELATTSVQLEPESVVALELLGYCALALERHEEVRLIAVAILDLAPDEVAGHALHAHVALEQEAPAKAVQHLHQALAIAPDDGQLIQMLADAQRRLRQFDASTELYGAALQATPGDSHSQQSIRGVMHKLALFGRRGARLRSPAAWLSGLTVSYLLVWLVLDIFVINPETMAWVNRAGFVLLPLVAVSIVTGMRRAFVQRHFPQFAIAYQMLNTGAGRRYLIGVPIVVGCIAGIAWVLYRDGYSLTLAFAPLWLPVVAVWLALGGLLFGILRAAFADLVAGARADPVVVARSIASANLVFDVLTGGVLFAIAIAWQSSIALVAALFVLLAVIVTGYARKPLRCALWLIASGLLVATIGDRLPTVIDLEPRLLGFLLTLFGLYIVLKALWVHMSGWRQRRRIRKTLASPSQSES